MIDDIQSDQIQVISQSQARKAGLEHYFTGLPCKHGHLALRRTRNADCVECNKVRGKQWHYANRDAALARMKADYETNHESRLRYHRNLYHNGDKAAWNAATQARRKANRERHNETSRLAWWRDIEKSRLRCRVKEIKRRGAKRNSQGSFTPDDLRQILSLQNFKCAMCKKSIKGAYHADHIMPLALGGSNARANIQALCPSCNMSKGAKHPAIFARASGLLL